MHLDKNFQKKEAIIRYIIPLILFIIAVIPRTLFLGTGLTFDERFWLVRSPNFFNAILQQDWIHTYQTGHPGVITMWLSGLSMHLFTSPGMDFPFTLIIGRVPIALVTSLAVVVCYFLLFKIFQEKIAILSAVLIALDPFFIAHSRFIHLDAILTICMLLSILSLLAYLNNPDLKYLRTLAGIFAGLSILTKTPAFFLLLFIPAAIMIWFILTYKGRDNKPLFPCFDKEMWKRILVNIILIYAISGIVYVLLWPAVWVNGLGIIMNIPSGIQHQVITPHGSGYLFEEVNNGDYGPIFYLLVLVMRSSPLTLLFSLIGAGYAIYIGFVRNISRREISILIFSLYVSLFTLQMGISAKAFDRYILPVFPVMCIIASFGIWQSLDSIGEYVKTRSNILKFPHKNRSIQTTLCVLIVSVILQVLLLAPIVPYYNSYYNPLLNGHYYAPDILMVGWGEGGDLAAAYLNLKPNAHNLRVAVQYPGFSEYFKGTTIGMESASSADYLVFYISTIQRGWNKDIWGKYKDKKPEKIIQINGINYCWIYKSF